LGWLDALAGQWNGCEETASPTVVAQRHARQRMKKLKAWQDSVRLTTDWEPPRMPDDLVKPFRL
jgi:hypothetical protein